MALHTQRRRLCKPRRKCLRPFAAGPLQAQFKPAWLLLLPPNFKSLRHEPRTTCQILKCNKYRATPKTIHTHTHTQRVSLVRTFAVPNYQMPSRGSTHTHTYTYECLVNITNIKEELFEVLKCCSNYLWPSSLILIINMIIFCF